MRNIQSFQLALAVVGSLVVSPCIATVNDPNTVSSAGQASGKILGSAGKAMLMSGLVTSAVAVAPLASGVSAAHAAAGSVNASRPNKGVFDRQPLEIGDESVTALPPTGEADKIPAKQ